MPVVFLDAVAPVFCQDPPEVGLIWVAAMAVSLSWWRRPGPCCSRGGGHDPGFAKAESRRVRRSERWRHEGRAADLLEGVAVALEGVGEVLPHHQDHREVGGG